MYMCVNVMFYLHFHSFPKGEDVVVGKNEEEEKSIQEPVSN